jgi:acyl-CoA thioester hydrolase
LPADLAGRDGTGHPQLEKQIDSQKLVATYSRVTVLCRDRIAILDRGTKSDVLYSSPRPAREILTTTHLDGAINDGRHTMQVRVFFEDTDFTGMVYHANYLRFMERGRSNYLRLLGADHRALFEETASEAPGFNFVVRSMNIDYLKPAFMDDVLDIITIPQDIKGASITLSQQCRRGTDLLVEALVRVAFVSGGKAQRIPKPLRLAMQQDRDGGRGTRE